MSSELMQESNLRQVRKRYQDRMEAIQDRMEAIIGENLISARQDLAEFARQDLVLREIVRFYGTVEVGCIASMFPKPLPMEFCEVSAQELKVHHPLPDNDYFFLRLTKLFRARLNGAWGQADYKSNDTLVSLYFQFLTTNETLDSNVNIQAFLLSLVYPSLWQEISEILHEPRKAVEQLFQPPSERDFLSRRLNGFSEFLDIIPQIGHLLDRAKDYDLFQSSVWHYYSAILGEPEVLSRLSMWFTCLRPFLDQAGIDDVENWGVETTSVLSRFQAVKYDEPLLRHGAKYI